MRYIAPVLSCAVLLVALLSMPALANTAQEARRALQTAVTRVLDNIRNPDWVNPATRGPLRRNVEDEVYHIFDFGEFSSRTVGPRWKSFNADEKKRFSDAFANLLFNTYLNKITGYNGENVEYTGERVQENPPRVEVRTIISMKDGKKTPVYYRMMPKDGGWRVYDVVIENMSLVKNYLTQFHDILRTATPGQLIARVQQRAREVAAEGK
ncbi:MAG: ABC transporter substrate-binding protein [Desulfovibrio sp.]|jgi:phospholipid transport system substrate-binding protein|nr:ABC transporter substrate-binding protein [Desulfovibrio sp.]